jgi:hypothetical protein
VRVSATVRVGAFVGGVRNGNAFQVTMSGGDSHSFECAIHALAPDVRVLRDEGDPGQKGSGDRA